jgi:prepilin-type N-terminal cleavage/methylation domain-containing protein
MRWAGSNSTNREKGFTLIEVLIALVVLSIMALGVAALFGVAIKAVHAARNQTSTAALATQKMEQLRSLTWGFDLVETGLPVSDTTTDLSRTPATSSGTGLNPSPTGTLDTNTAGFVDYLDARGQWVGTGAAPPANAIYIRRWSIEPLPTNPNNTLVLQVLVTTTLREASVAGVTGPRRRYADDALIATVKTRKAR